MRARRTAVAVVAWFAAMLLVAMAMERYEARVSTVEQAHEVNR